MCFFSPQQMQSMGAIAAQVLPNLHGQISGGMQGSPPGAAPAGGPVVYRAPGVAPPGLPATSTPMPGPEAPPMMASPGMSPMMGGPPPGAQPLHPTGPPTGARPLIHRPLQGAPRR